MIDRRTLLGGAAGIAAGMGLSGCGRAGRGSVTSAEDAPATWLTVRVGVPQAIDPLLVSDRAGLQVLHALFCPLTRIEDGRAVGNAARSFEVSKDARTVTFHLVEGATFHTGGVVTASAFKRAWERIVKPLDQDERSGKDKRDEDAEEFAHSRWAELLSAVEGYEALHEGRASELVGLRCPDDNTLVVTLSRPFAGFAEVASHPALGPVPASADQDPEAFAAQPVGNGPFALKEPWDGKAGLALARFDTCAYGVAHVEGVQFVIAGETVSGYHQFQAGNLDICDVPVDQLEDAEETAGTSANAFDMYPGERLVHGAEPGLTYLVCNTRVSPFDRAEFRHAVSCAIDRETLCRKALNYSAEPAWSLVAPTVGEMPAWEACTFDAERAVEQVEALRSEAVDAAETGADPAMGSAEADGSVGAAGSATAPEGSENSAAAESAAEPLELDFTLLRRKGGVQGHIADQVTADLKDAGVTVKTEALDASDLLERLSQGEFSCAVVTCDPVAATPTATVEALFGASAGRAAWSGLDAGERSAAVDAVEAAADDASREERVREVVALAGESLDVIPLVHPAYTKIATERVSHARVDPWGAVDCATVELA